MNDNIVRSSRSLASVRDGGVILTIMSEPHTASQVEDILAPIIMFDIAVI